MRIREWQPSCSMRADRRTDMMKLTVAFRNFANAPKSSISKTKPSYPVFMWTLPVHTEPRWSCQYKLNLDIIQNLNIPPYKLQHKTVNENIVDGDEPYSTDVCLGLHTHFMTLTGNTF